MINDALRRGSGQGARYGLGAHAGLRNGDGGPRAAGAERISGRREPHPQGATEWPAEAFGRHARRPGEGFFAQARKGNVDMDAMGARIKARKGALLTTIKQTGLPPP